jgi:hypothetical protein
MNSMELIRRMVDLFARCIEIAEAKNADYANEDDPFQNFRGVEVLGISVEDGFLTRMSDKLARVSNLVRRDPAVADESVLDTLSDLANYAILLRVYLEQERMGYDEIPELTKELFDESQVNVGVKVAAVSDAECPTCRYRKEFNAAVAERYRLKKDWKDFPPSDDKRSWVDLPTKVYGIGGHYGGVEGDEPFAP